MEERLTELYLEDGKQLLDLVQEWIGENSSVVYCILDKVEIKCNCR